MMQFWNREADVLVCSTIIESGLDVPNANTLIVDRADRLGLAQMYQLRGRVGRSAERAFAYLFFPPEREMTDEARERLATIGKHQALGSGFQIALRDLEIRGAGNLLGAEQSGHIAAVGFDAYARILQESMAEMKGEEIPVEAELRIDLPVKAFVPPGWVEQESLRLELYRRISMASNHEALEQIRRETVDRFGELPEPGGDAVRDRVVAGLVPQRWASRRCPRTRIRSASGRWTSRSGSSPISTPASTRPPITTRPGP